MQRYLAIAIGGALGSLARYSVGSAVASRLGARFPYGTLLINLSACIVLGFSLAFLNRRTAISPFWRYLFPIGFVGAYSTFSTFEWETFSGLQAGEFFLSGLYVALSLILGLFAVWCGVLLEKLIS